MSSRQILTRLTVFVFLMQILGSSWAMYGAAGHHLAGSPASADAAVLQSHEMVSSASEGKLPCPHQSIRTMPRLTADFDALHSEPLRTAGGQSDHECTCGAVCQAGVDVLILPGIHVLVGSPCTVSIDAILEQDFVPAVPRKPPRA